MSLELLIGELANQWGISPQAIRYYERLGLLNQPQRTKAGYRLYSEEALERLKFIRSAQNFGLSLNEIKQLIDLKCQSITSYIKFKNMVKAHLEELEQQIDKLTVTRQDLARRFEQINNLIPDDDVESARVISNYSLLNLMQQVEASSSVDGRITVLDKANELLQLYSAGERDFQGIELIGAKLSGAILSDANFSRAEMMLASLNEVSMVRTKLKGVYLNGADLVGAYLKQAEITGAVLIGVDLSEANLMEATLVGSNLGGACLRGANLQGANLSEAVLIGADLSGADLTGAIFLGSNFFEANLKDAILDKSALSQLQE